MQNGWIKLHRKLFENPIFDNEKALKIWIWCLLKAGHQENTILLGRNKIDLKAGEFVMGSKKESEFLKIAKSTLWFWLEFLQNEKQLELKKTNKYTIVKLKNWNKYQIVELKSDSNQDADGTQIGTNKKNKNEKNDKEVINIAGKPANEINQVMTIFSKINPTLNWGNKTQRQAIQDMINKLGLERTIKSAEAAIAVYGEQYAPVITTPYKLKEKLSDLIAFYNKSKSRTAIIS